MGAFVNEKSSTPISRREFARRTAIVSAISLASPSASPLYSEVGQSATQQPSNLPPLSPEALAEAEARYQAILALYGSRFSDAQKPELRRLCFLAQPPLDRLRAYPVKNGDAPALYLKPLVEREKPPAPASAPRKARQPVRKS